jgi:hypothetical protein
MTFWVAGAVVGSSLIGARAAGKAADTQAGAMEPLRNCNTNNTKKTLQDKNRFTTSASMRCQNWLKHHDTNRLLWISFKLIQATRFG